MRVTDADLAEYVLGTSNRAVTDRIEAMMPLSVPLRRELDQVTAALAVVAETLSVVPPAAAVRQRLMEALTGVERFAPFLPRLSQLFDLSLPALRGVLTRVDDPAAWGQLAPGWAIEVPGCHFMDFTPGPRLAGLDAGLVRMAPATQFPRHRHRGIEVTFVLEGTHICGDRSFGPGDIVEMPPGSEHQHRAGADRDLLLAVHHQGYELP